MTHGILDVFSHALMIASFVFTMMLVIEYVNVLTRGAWQQRLGRHSWGQYVFAALLGATPGCLGAFAVVAMYSHGIVRFGAVVAAMIATSGDEAYVMLAMIPKQGMLLMGGLFVLGITAGFATDVLFAGTGSRYPLHPKTFDVHDVEQCRCLPRDRIVHQWKNCTAARGILSVVLTVLTFAVIAGWIGHPEWDWMRVTLLVVSLVGLFIVCTVPDHFLEEHLWQHVARKHAPRVFLWTLGALLVMYVLTERLDLEQAIRENKYVVLLVACLVGLIPESGPHLIFVTFYAQGTIPLSVLLASSVVQDGHGMLPLLADSRRAFVQIKAINFAVGLLCGLLAMMFGF